MSGLRDHIHIIQGKFPNSENESNGEVLEVLISQTMAADNGFQVGDVYQFVASEGWFRQNDVLGRVPIKIAGIWEPINPEDSYWISTPDYYKNVLFISEEAFAGRVNQTIPNAIFSAYWYFVMDGSQVYSGDVRPLLQRINILDRSATDALL